MKSTFYYTFIVLFSTLIISCGQTSTLESIKVPVEPSEEIIQQLQGKDFSIVLNDMNISEKDNKRLFEHKYHILKVIKDSLVVDSLSWKTVNQSFFEKHQGDLGMEIVSNHNGKLSKTAQPVGFGWAIGNPKYGEWEEVSKTQDSTSIANTTTNSNTRSERRWRSHGPSLLFWYWMLRRPTYQRDYAGYRTASTAGRSYYGSQSNGTSKYGTNSTYQKAKRPSFFNRRRSSNSWKSYTTSSKKTSRSSSRYKSSSSTRSRSGGFGK